MGDSTSRRTPWPRAGHLLLLAILFTLFAVYGSWVPLNYQPKDFHVALAEFGEIPFLRLGIGSRADWVANILLFVPLGFFWLGALSVDRPRWVGGVAALPLIPSLTALSLAIEFSQLWFPGRTVSQNDIVAETLGGILGSGLWLTYGQRGVEWVRGFAGSRDRGRQIDWLLQAYAVGLLIYSLMPFDIAISPAELYQKVKEGKVSLVPFAGSADDWRLAIFSTVRDVLLFVPIGALAARLFLPRGQSVRAFWPAFGLGTAFVVGIECAQLFVYSRYSAVTDVLLGAVGIAGGVCLAHYAVHRTVHMGSLYQPSAVGRTTWVLAGGILAYTAFLLGTFWYPYEFTSDRALIKERLRDMLHRPPFAALYAGAEFNAFVQMLFRVCTFAPLGALCALAVLSATRNPLARRWLGVLLFLLCAGLAAVIEVGQVLLPSRVADLTELVFYAGGAGLGMWLTFRLIGPAPRQAS